MKVEMKHPQTNEMITVDIDDSVALQIEEQLAPGVSKAQLHTVLDNLNINAEVKAILHTVADVTIKIGNSAVYLGRKLLEVIVVSVKKFPNTAIGLVIGTVLGIIISSIPVLGWLLGWLLTPLCSALGLVVGFYLDVKDKQLESAVKRYADDVFNGLKSVPTS